MKFVLFLVILAVIGLFVIMALYSFFKSEGAFRRKSKYKIKTIAVGSKEQVQLMTPDGDTHLMGFPYARGDDIEREVQFRDAKRMKDQLEKFD